MKALILMTATGQGHKSAAAAVAESLNLLGCETVTADVLSMAGKNVSPFISGFYDGLVNRAPAAFGAIYNAGGLVSSPKRHSPIYYLNSLYSDSFYNKIQQTDPDVIICTHIFSAQALTYLYEKGKTSIPSLVIMTDYTCSPFWEETKPSMFVIPSGLLTDEFAKKGIPRDKIIPLGIPVANKFKGKKDRQYARDSLSIPRDKAVFLCMGGSMGHGDMRRLCLELSRLSPGCLILAVCGRNKGLYGNICNLPQVTAYTFTDNIDLLIDASDAVITKPGGLSITEIAVKTAPLILTGAIPGCETKNAELFEKCKMAKTAGKPEQAAEAAVNLINSREEINSMCTAQRKYIDADAGEKIARLAVKTARQ